MKRNIGIISFFLSCLLFASLILNPLKAQTSTDATLILPGVQQFFDNNGNPLSSGKVYFYEVGTTTFKPTWTSSTATITNVNPIVLNAGGKAPTGGIWGTGQYRQVVKASNGNLVWDAVTETAGGSGTTPTAVGDGNLVGTVLPWSGLIAPNQYVFAYGQELARASFPEFYTAITQQLNVICTSASNILTGISDTTQIKIGSPVELALCVSTGTTVVSKTGSSVTLSNPSSVSINTVATFFPWGDGNSSTTFNVPDFRGSTLSGRDNMGGSAASRLVNGAATGQTLALSTTTLTYQSQAPTQTVIITSGTYSVPAGVNSINVKMVAAGGGGGAVATNDGNDGTDTSFSTWTAIHGSKGLKGTVGTGGVGGTGGVNGTGTLVRRQAGGVGGSNPNGGGAIGVSPNGGSTPFSAGAPIGVGIINGAVAPNNTGAGGGGGSTTATTAGGAGGGGEYVEFNVTSLLTGYTVVIGTKGLGGAAGTQAGGNGSDGIAIVTEYYSTSTTPSLTSTTAGTVQFTDTINYIVKVTPDTSTSIATGVFSIGGMTGVIACGSGLLCTGNIISAPGSAAGNDTNIIFNNVGILAGSNNLNFISPDNLTLGASGVTGKFDIFGSGSGRIRQVARAAAGTPTITWGTSSGTPAVTAIAPITITAATGEIGCPTCSVTTPSALTRTNDTNVIITLGGTPTTALLTPVSLTLGWSGQLAVGRGGTGLASGISGGILFFDSTSTMSNSSLLTANALMVGGGGGISPKTLASLGTTTTVLHGNAGGAPLFGAVNLLQDVSQILPVANGGTGIGNGVSGGVLYFSSSSIITSSSLLTANQIMLGGGSGNPPTTFSCATTTTVVHGGTPPACGQIVAGDITTNTITNSNLAQVAAFTFKGNPTSGTANVQDFTIPSLTNKASPTGSDLLILADAAASNATKYCTITQCLAAVTSGVSSVNSLTGALTLAVSGGLNIVSGGTTITITPDIATAANFEAGTANKLLDANVVFSSEATTTFSTTTVFDFNTFINSKVTLTGNITTMNCSNMKASQSGMITFIQDSTGSRTAAFNTGTCSTTLKFASATFPTLTTSASAIDILNYSCRSSSYCEAGLAKGFNP